jgi:gag-polypeptide of LTR copia-type
MASDASTRSTSRNVASTDTTFSVQSGHPTIAKLTTKNYGVWQIKARAILRKDKLWELVSAPLSTMASTTTTPTDERYIDAADILLLIISDELLGRLTLEEQNNGQKLWNRLKYMLQPTGVQQFITLQQQHQALRHHPDSETLDEFLFEEKRLRDEMSATRITLSEDLKQVIFLMSSMPSKYASIIQLWDSMRESDLTADKAISMLRHEELRQKQEDDLSGKEKNLALKASSNPRTPRGNSNSKGGRNPDRKGLHCQFCDIKDSHIEENCWKKYPEKKKSKKDSKMEEKSDPKKDSKKDSKKDLNKAYTAGFRNKAYFFGFSNKALASTQLDTLDSWIIGSGATRHLTSNYDQLYDFEAYKAISSTEGIIGQIDIIGEGKLDLRCIGTDNVVRTVSISGVQYAPKANCKL